MALPGWYSLSSVAEIHATLEGIAVAFFVALVVFDVLAHLNKKREILFERIALVCFAIAVLGEVCAYPYSRRIDTLSKEASEVTEGKIAALNKEAADARKETESIKRDAISFSVQLASAKKDAAEANVLAKKYESQLASANATAAEARSMAKGFEAEIAVANRRAAEANELARREELAFAQLRARLADRVLTSGQQTELISRLSAIRGITIDVITWGDSSEVQGISIQVLNCLHGAGWQIIPASPVGL